MAGLSRDSVASHAKFAAKLGLGYSLLADPETSLIQALGAWGEKKMYGKVSQGPIRSTFIANQSGKLHQGLPQGQGQGSRGNSAGGVVARSRGPLTPGRTNA